MAYDSTGLHPPVGLYVHSMWGVVTCWALFWLVLDQDICAAGQWHTPSLREHMLRLSASHDHCSARLLLGSGAEGVSMVMYFKHIPANQGYIWNLKCL